MKRALVLGLWAPWSMVFILGTAVKDCGKPSPETCAACAAAPTLPGCEKILKACQVQPTPTPPPTTTTMTTTLPPEPLPTPSTTPSPSVVCKAPQGANWTVVGKSARFDSAVNDAMAEISRCRIGSDCSTDKAPMVWLDLVNEELIHRGFCAGKHRPDTDEIAVSCEILSGDELRCLRAKCDSVYEGKHIAHFNSPTNAKIVWCPGANRDTWQPSGGVCGISEPIPTPPPTPLPTPGPTPVPGACPVKVEQGYFVDLVVGHIGTNPQQFTASAKYCGFPVRQDIFPFCGTKCCVLGVDGVDKEHPSDPRNRNPIPCEVELSGPPTWPCSDTLQCVPAFDDNPYNMKVTGGFGILKACAKSSCSNQIKYP